MQVHITQVEGRVILAVASTFSLFLDVRPERGAVK